MVKIFFKKKQTTHYEHKSINKKTISLSIKQPIQSIFTVFKKIKDKIYHAKIWLLLYIYQKETNIQTLYIVYIFKAKKANHYFFLYLLKINTYKHHETKGI